MAFNRDKFKRLNIDWKTSSERIIENAEEGIAFFNPQFEVVFWNEYIEKLTGKSKKDLEGKKLQEVLPSLTLSELTELLSGETDNLNKLQDKFEITVVPSYNESNEITGGVAILKGCKSPGSKTLKRFDAVNFKTIFENLPGLYIVLSPALDVLAVSHSYLRSTYLKKERILHKNIFDVLNLNQGARRSNAIDNLKESLNYVLQNKVRHEVPVQRFDVKRSPNSRLQKRYWSISNIPVLNNEANVLYIIINLADITVEYKSQTEVDDNRKRLELLSTSANVVVWEYDFINDELWWNQNFQTVFKHPIPKGKSTLSTWIENIHPEDRERVTKSFHNAIANGHKKWMEDYRYMKGDGTYAHVQDTGYIFLDKAGKPYTIVGTLLDITKTKETENKIKAMAESFYRKNQQLRKANEMLDTFVYAAAHDLKSPVNNLKSLMDLVNRTSDEDQKRIFMDAINSSIARLDKTIKSLTEIIEIQSNKDVSIKEIKLSEVVEQVLADYEKEIAAHEIEIIKDFDKEKEFRYNEAFIMSILMNLLSNAIKYRSEKRKPIIHITCHKESEYTILTIADNGIGIDLERYKDNLFKPFKRFTQQQEGKGIGLHLIKSIVEKNGGKIEVESELDKGTRFTIYLKEYDIQDNIEF